MPVYLKRLMNSLIGVFQFARELGYDKGLCDNVIRSIYRSFSKMFVVDKAKGGRKDNILSATRQLEAFPLLVKKLPWYYLSYLPGRLLNLAMRMLLFLRRYCWKESHE